MGSILGMTTGNRSKRTAATIFSEAADVQNPLRFKDRAIDVDACIFCPRPFDFFLSFLSASEKTSPP